MELRSDSTSQCGLHESQRRLASRQQLNKGPRKEYTDFCTSYSQICDALTAATIEMALVCVLKSSCDLKETQEGQQLPEGTGQAIFKCSEAVPARAATSPELATTDAVTSVREKGWKKKRGINNM
eukprot:6180306-Pleurochrysis_carterae.AAC.3